LELAWWLAMPSTVVAETFQHQVLDRISQIADLLMLL
jgi:hypothetical protein